MHLKSVQETAIDPAIPVKKESKINKSTGNAINRQGLKSGSFVGCTANANNCVSDSNLYIHR